MKNLLKLISKSSLFNNGIKFNQVKLSCAKLNYSNNSIFDDINPIEDLKDSDKILSYAMKMREFDEQEQLIKETKLILPHNNTKEEESIDFSIFQNCIIVVKKLELWNTFSIIMKLRHAIGNINFKIAHLGALEVTTSGIVVLLFGHATKKLDALKQQDHEFEGKFRIGSISKTGSSASRIEEKLPWQHITNKDVKEVADKLTGNVYLTMPNYMSVKSHQYLLCKTVKLGYVKRQPYETNVNNFEVSRIRENSNEFEFKTTVSHTCKINSLIHTLGKELGTGAYITQLNRKRIGKYTEKEAWDIDELSVFIKGLRKLAYLNDEELHDRIRAMDRKPWRKRPKKVRRKLAKIRKMRIKGLLLKPLPDELYST